MKLALLSVFLALPLMFGCNVATSTTPPAALAPGYSNADDQKLGQSLAAVNAFITQEKINYAELTAAQQAPEKPFLNALIDATNLANQAYMAYHAGSGTIAQAQTAVANAQAAQGKLAAQKGGK